MSNPYAPPESNVELNALSSMNWGKVVVYATILFLAQFAIGFIEGAFAPSVPRVLGSAAISFVVCCAIFTHLAAHQPSRPFVHAWSALLLQVGVGALVANVFVGGPDSAHFALIALDWLAPIVALIVGTIVGHTLRRRSLLRAQKSVQPDRRED